MAAASPQPFQNGPDHHISEFIYQGEPRLLGAYLLERYGSARGEAWRESFYPARVRMNGAEVNGATLASPGDRVSYLHRRDEEPAPPELGQPLYEDAWLLALHKPDSIPVNPSGLYYFTSLAILARNVFANPELTPLHRIDLETDGVVLFAKARRFIKPFHQLFERKTIRKTYRALARGVFPSSCQEISGWIAPCADSAIHTKLWLYPKGEGTPSQTRVLGVRPRGRFSDVELEPVTGKTNQLRVHLAAMGHAIIGDKKYHPDEGIFLDWIAHRDFERLREALVLPRQALQCTAMAFEHPFSGQPLRIEARPVSWEEKIGAAIG